MRLTIDITEEEVKILKKRGKKNFLKLKEQVEDILRRSCINVKQDLYPKTKVDDALVEIFSRERRGKIIQKKKKKLSLKELFWGEKDKRKRKKVNKNKNNSNKTTNIQSMTNMPEPAFRDK